jgi:hypothetical protein
MKILTSSLIAATLLTSLSADSLSDAFKNGTVAGELKAMYLSDTDINIEGYAVGGSIGYTTAEYYGLSAGATFYTVHGLGGADADTEGTLLLKGREATSMLGQAYLQYKLSNTVLKVGRQQIDTPLAGSDNIRIIPNLFEAALLINSDLPNTTLIAGHVSKMMGLVDGPGDTFQHMSDASPASGVVSNKGVSVVAGIYSNKDIGVDAQLWDYYAYDILNAVYFDLTYSISDFSVAGQYYTYSELGAVKDAGVKVGYDVMGAKGAYSNENLGIDLTLAYNKVGDSDMDVSVFGTWGGYPEFVFADETWFYSFGDSGSGARDAQAYSLALDYACKKIDGLGLTLKYVGFDMNEKYGSQDVDIVDVIANYAVNDNLALSATYENGSSDDKAFDRDVYKVGATYSF